MTHTLAIVLATLIPMAALAADPVPQEADGVFRQAGDTTLDSFLWTARPIVVFADSPADPRFQQQIDLLRKEEARLEDRDVVVLMDTDPAAHSPIRTRLRPRGFQIVLVDKDGGIKLRKPFPGSVREITRTIDNTDSRKREVEERRSGR